MLFRSATTGGGIVSFSNSFSMRKPAGASPFLAAVMSSCIVLIDDLKTGGAGSTLGPGGGGGILGPGSVGNAEGIGGLGFGSNRGGGMPTGGGLGKEVVGTGVAPSFVGKLGGGGCPAGPGCWLSGGTLIWGLIGLGPPRPEGFVRSAIWISD